MNKSYVAAVDGGPTPEDGSTSLLAMLAPILAIAPATLSWSPKVALVMIVCNVIAIAIGKATIKYPSEGAKLPNPAFFGGMSHASLLATTSLGHVFGIGAIQGLAARGVL